MTPESFAVVTGVIHKGWEGRIYAYGPYVQEMNLWAGNFKRVLVCAPIVEERPASNESQYVHDDLSFVRLPKTGGRSLTAKAISVAHSPLILYRLFRSLRRVDHVHLRLPSNMGFWGLLLCPLLAARKTAKYAAQWTSYEKEPLSYRLQKELVSTAFWFKRGKVLVYGNWPDQSDNVVPFFTASYWQTEVAEAGSVIVNKSLVTEGDINIAFVGRITENKGGVDALDALKILRERDARVVLHIVGDGYDLPRLREYARHLGLASCVRFHGNLDKGGVSEILRRSHFLLSLSQTEGWPKVVAEGMVWGAVPIATSVSCTPWMLGNGERGALIERNGRSAAEAVDNYLRAPERYTSARDKGHEWARQFTLERFGEAIRAIC